MSFQLSPQQQDAVDWVRDGHGSAFVEAVAGAGKTTLLVEVTKETTGSVAFCAYNKKIADEIKGRIARLNLGSRVRAGTFHSFGLSAWRYIYRDVEIDARKKQDILTFECLKDQDHQDGIVPVVHKLASLAKQRAIGVFGSIEDERLWWEIVDHFDLAHEVESEALLPRVVDRAIEVLNLSNDLGKEIIDFDDMIYLPLYKGIRMWQNDWVLVDEGQDTNPARRGLARKMLKPDGRAMFVGDRHQAIYGFTGADSDAVDQIIEDFDAIQLPLTVTFRCPKKVVEASQAYVSHIQAHESAPEGSVRVVEADEWADLVHDKAFHPTKDAILCRLTRPLVTVAYQLIRRGVACHVEGRDIGNGLLVLVNRWKVRSMDTLLKRLKIFKEREVQKLIAKGRETQAQAIEDKVDTIFILAEGCNTIDALREKIRTLFLDSDQERKPTLTLSTIHKAKGREWDRVFILARDLMPSPWARQPWQQEQETNLIYVAYTRAKKELCLIMTDDPFTGGVPKEEKGVGQSKILPTALEEIARAQNERNQV